jgi:hypothetical protein
MLMNSVKLTTILVNVVEVNGGSQHKQQNYQKLSPQDLGKIKISCCWMSHVV